ncbi:MAG: hypothetical protein ACLFVT_05835 [Syntrophobacteria bacterium]
MSFKENLKAKIQLDRIVRKLAATIREVPGQRRVDKTLMRKLLEMTDLEPKKVRDLDLYVRRLDEVMEILVFDNELPIYHTTLADVAMRKSPEWKEMFSIKNIKRILNDQDVVVSKGKESLSRVHARALDLLDLSYTREDLAELVEDARLGLEQKSLTQIKESFDLFFELLDFQALSLGVVEENFQVFAKPKMNGGEAPLFEHLLLFDPENLSVALRKGPFSPQSESDIAWVVQYATGEAVADLEGGEVFEFLAELALQKQQT